MRAGRLRIGLLASLFVWVAACSRSDIDLGDTDDGGPPGNGQSASGSSSGAGAGGSGSSSGAGSSGSSGFVGSSGSSGFPGSSGSSGFVGSSGNSSGLTGPCAPSLLSYMVAPTFEKCWSCVEGGCSTALMACAQDCGCNKSIVSALGCVNGGGTPFSCFSPAITAGGDPATSSLASCLLQAGSDCGCQENTPGGGPGMPPPVPDASAACMITGGGSTSGDGACSSTIQETCGGTEYQAVCACPQGRCVCFGNTTTTVINIGSCPYCPESTLKSPNALDPNAVLSMCGFPQ
jgi:hypothetical protein